MIEIVADEIVVRGLNPMSEAPHHHFYDEEKVLTVLALIRTNTDPDETECYWCEVYFNREKMAFSHIENNHRVYEDWQLLGWIEPPSFDLSLIENKESNAA